MSPDKDLISTGHSMRPQCNCPVCGVLVNTVRLQAHLLRVHPNGKQPPRTVRVIQLEHQDPAASSQRSKSRWRLYCPLCGERIAPGNMLTHKAARHGETQRYRSNSAGSRSPRTWVSIVQGGLPGLGKRR